MEFALTGAYGNTQKMILQRSAEASAPTMAYETR